MFSFFGICFKIIIFAQCKNQVDLLGLLTMLRMYYCWKNVLSFILSVFSFFQRFELAHSMTTRIILLRYFANHRISDSVGVNKCSKRLSTRKKFEKDKREIKIKMKMKKKKKKPELWKQISWEHYNEHKSFTEHSLRRKLCWHFASTKK